jgi:RNA polymerase sigma factor (sigma-70 family)
LGDNLPQAMLIPVDVRAAFLRFRDHGDTASLAEVFDQVAQKLLLIASHVADRWQQPEDLVQETFLTAIQKADRFDEQRPLEPWLVGILVNVTRNDRRRQLRERNSGVAAEEVGVAARQPSDEVAESEFVQHLKLAIESLPLPQREVMTLNLVHGMTPTEIAHATSRPVGTVKSWIHRSLETVRQRLPVGLTATFAVVLRGMEGLEAARQNVLHAAGAGSLATASVVVAGDSAVVMPAVAAPAVAIASILRRVALLALMLGAPILFYWMAREQAVAGGPGTGPAVVASSAPLATEEVAASGADLERLAVPPATPPAALAPGTGRLHLVGEFDGEPFVWRGYVVSMGLPDAMLWRVPFVTGRLGSYTFEGVPFGNYSLQPDRGAKVAFSIDAPDITVRVSMPKAHDVHGRVLDEHGHGVAEAEIVQTIEGRLDDHMLVAVSDARGAFVVRSATPGRFLAAMAPGWFPSHLVPVVMADGAEQQEVELRLDAPAQTLDIEVVDEVGKALAGALLQVGSMVGPVPERESDRAHAIRPPWTGISDAHGRARCVGVPRDREAQLYVRATGRPGVKVALLAAELSSLLRVVLPKGATCVGTVNRPPDIPVAAIVRATSLTDRTSPQIPGWFWPTCMTFEGGQFRLHGVPIGKVLLQARTLAGEHTQTVRQLVAGQVVQWSAEIGESGSIAGKVLDSDGRAMVGQIVCCVAKGQPLQHATTVEDGRFELHGLAGQSCDLSVQLDTHQNALVLHRQAGVAVGSDVILQVPRERVPSASLRGRWVLPRADQICLFDAQSNEFLHVALAVDGAFAFAEVPPGDYVLIAGSQRIELCRDVRLAPNAVVDLGAIEAPPLVAVLITYGEPGDAPANLFVTSEQCGPTIAYAHTTPGEPYRLELPPGRFRFRFQQGVLDVCSQVVDVQPDLAPLVFSRVEGDEIVLPVHSRANRVHYRIEDTASGVVRRYAATRSRDSDPDTPIALRVLLPSSRYSVRCWSDDGSSAEANFTTPLPVGAHAPELILN